MIEIRVAFVLKLIDDFNGRPIFKKKFSFKVDGRDYRPIEKEEGLFVFLEPIQEKSRVEVFSSDFYTPSLLHPQSSEVR